MAEALLERGQPLLELRGIEKHFGPVRALRKIDLTVEAGTVTALCGDNGAGKSVTVKIISGIFQPDGGEIVWRDGREGRPLVRSPSSVLRTSDQASCPAQRLSSGPAPLRSRYRCRSVTTA